jgi:hypothetical protein
LCYSIGAIHNLGKPVNDRIDMKICQICQSEYDETAPATVFGEAGEWLAAEIWQDSGQLCPQCLENRARLAMMYLIDR